MVRHLFKGNNKDIGAIFIGIVLSSFFTFYFYSLFTASFEQVFADK